jgi:D-alanine-D-alanine ligase
MRTVVAVLRGGPSSEYEVSLRSGASVLESLDREKYEPRDIFIDRQGSWHLHGIPLAPERALRGVDVAWNAIHGEYGEDGRLQRILDALAVPYTGSRAHESTLAFNKHRTKEAVAEAGMRVAYGKVVEVPQSPDGRERLALELFRSMPLPLMVKPVIGGSSVGTTRVMHFHALPYALEQVLQVSERALVEELIVGTEATVGVIDDFRGQDLYALMPIEILPPPGRFFDAEVKYNGQTIERVPGNFTPEQKSELERLAKLAHKTLGASHYSRSDFIVSKRGIYFLELNSAQAVGLTKESLLPKALEAAGAPLPHFIDHIVSLARKS